MNTWNSWMVLEGGSERWRARVKDISTLYELFRLQVHYDPAAAAKSLQSCPPLCDPTDAAHQAPPALGFSRQGHWSGLPFPSPMHESEKGKWSRSVVSNSSRPQGLQPTRLPRPWDSPGRSTGVGCHCRLCIMTQVGQIRRFCRLFPPVSLFVLPFLPPPYAFLTALPFSLLYPLSSLFFLPDACPVTTGLIFSTLILVERLWTFEFHFFNDNMRRSVDICPVNWWKSLKKKIKTFKVSENGPNGI